MNTPRTVRLAAWPPLLAAHQIHFAMVLMPKSLLSSSPKARCACAPITRHVLSSQCKSRSSQPGSTRRIWCRCSCIRAGSRVGSQSGSRLTAGSSSSTDRFCCRDGRCVSRTLPPWFAKAPSCQKMIRSVPGTYSSDIQRKSDFWPSADRRRLFCLAMCRRPFIRQSPCTVATMCRTCCRRSWTRFAPGGSTPERSTPRTCSSRCVQHRISCVRPSAMRPELRRLFCYAVSGDCTVLPRIANSYHATALRDLTSVAPPAGCGCHVYGAI